MRKGFHGGGIFSRLTSWQGIAIALAALLVAGGVLAAVLTRDSESEESEARFAENALHEVAKEGLEAREAVFEDEGGEEGELEGEGGEARREGPRTPATEQVDNRAYPRAFVDDRRAIKVRRAFRRIPSSPSPDTFASGGEFQTAAATDAPWTELGPVTPNVAGEASQFFDPATLEGPATQESGRVTALAIDPACTTGDCRLWVAAAGGGVWRTDDALAATPDWVAPPNNLPTTAFGSLYYDAANDVLYAGSGEPNGSSDSEAGLGLFKSTDSGDSWSLVPGSQDVAINRSIAAIAVDPQDADTIYIGTALARHGSSSVNGGRRTPPDAPTLGVYRSTDGGATFELEQDLADKALPDPTDPGEGNGIDFFAGGISKLLLDPNDPEQLYAAIFGYGLWRADQSGTGDPTWEQVFHTMNQNDFTDPEVFVGDSGGDETEFDFFDDAGTTGIYVGDASDDWAIDGDDPPTPAPRAWRNADATGIVGDPDGQLDPMTDPMGDVFNTDQGWEELSSADPADPGFAVYNYCQNGQCSYDSLMAHPPGSDPGVVWYLGSMNYDELPAYDQFGTGAPPRSNGRAVIRSTNADDGTIGNVEWQDMTAILEDPNEAWGVASGIHPDLRAAAFSDDGDTAFIGQDGGVVRIDVSAPQDQSASCDERQWNYDPEDPLADPVDLNADDLALCQMLLGGVPTSLEPVNDGLRTIQFQSVSLNPQDPTGEILGGTQDNGTWSYDATAAEADRWFESVGGDGGQSGFNPDDADVRYHNYFDATPEVNFNGDDPTTWLATYDPLQLSDEARSFYTPFTPDPVVAGRVFTGLQHVWRTDDNGGEEQFLIDNGCEAVALDPFREEPCGDWVEMGGDLTSAAFGADRGGEFVVAVERAPSDEGTLWAATRTGRLFVTSNADETSPGSVTFRRIDTEETPGRFVSGIAVDPSDPNHAWISYSGYDAYTPDTPGHVFEAQYNPSTHAATFTDLSHNLGDQPITDIAEYGANGNLFAGTDFGVLELPAGSTEWVEAGNGFPKTAVYALAISQEGRALTAATHGRGAYSLELPEVPPAPGEKPTAKLKRIKPVDLGEKSKIRGVAKDPDGLESATVKFGDGTKKVVHPKASGKFKVRHRYEEAGKYKVKLKVVGTDGDKATAKRTARVKPA